MKKWLAFIGLAFTLSAHSQNVTISGYIRDAATGEELINASIINEERQGTVSNIYGFYSLTLPAGKQTFTVSFIGYTSEVRTINLSSSKTVDFELSEATNELAEVEVTAKKLDENLNRAEMSTTQLSALSCVVDISARFKFSSNFLAVTSTSANSFVASLNSKSTVLLLLKLMVRTSLVYPMKLTVKVCFPAGSVKE